MAEPSQPDKDSSTHYTEMELFVRERNPGEHDFRIAYRMGPHASAGVAQVYGSNVGISPDVARALAQLMASAPKLLKALKAAGELWGYLPFDSGADIQEVAQRVAKLQRTAIEEAKS